MSHKKRKARIDEDRLLDLPIEKLKLGDLVDGGLFRRIHVVATPHGVVRTVTVQARQIRADSHELL